MTDEQILKAASRLASIKYHEDEIAAHCRQITVLQERIRLDRAAIDAMQTPEQCARPGIDVD